MAGWRIESLGEEASGLHGDEPSLVLLLRGVAGAARLEVHKGGYGGGGPVELGLAGPWNSGEDWWSATTMCRTVTGSESSSPCQ